MSDDTEYVPQDEAPVSDSKVSVTFDRKVSDGNYGGIECRAWVEGSVNNGATAEAIVTKLQELFAAAKVVVLDELGIPYVMDDNGVVREKNIPTVGAVSPETRVEHALQPNRSIKIMNPNEQDGPVPAEVYDWAEANGFTAIFDNRKGRKGNQPHFRQALTKAQRDAGVSAAGYWLKG